MLGQRIAALRRHLGMSQSALAEKIGVSPSAVGMYEQDRREPSLSAMVTMSEVLGVSVDYLLTGRPLTERDERILRDTLFSASQRAQARALGRRQGLSKEELGVLFAAMLAEP